MSIDLGLSPEDTYPVLTLGELLTLEVEPKQWLLDGLLRQRELAQVYGPRGLGKTWLSLAIAYAVATGGKALKWRAPEPRPVLYVDGEMDVEDLKERMRRMVVSEMRSSIHMGSLFFLSSHNTTGGIGDMAAPEVRDRIDATADKAGAQLIVVDNLSCLFSTRDENAAAEFNVFNNWLLSQRRAGRSVLFVHHAGKGGQQRGTSRREDSLDLVLGLKAIDDDAGDDEPRTGCRFNLMFEKARSLQGEQTEPLTVQRDGDVWSCKALKSHRAEEVIRLWSMDMPQTQIAQALGITQPAVHKILVKRGAITPKTGHKCHT